MSCSTLTLREKDVINTTNGKKLGVIEELEIDTECGRITAILVGKERLILFGFKKKFIRIRWEKIIRIGCDTILVEYKEDSCECSDKCKNK